MYVTIERGTDEVVAAVHGEIDADNCADLGARLLDDTAGPGTMIVDLSGLAFIDSSGINELIKVAETVRERGQSLELRNPSPAVHRVLEITGLLGHFGLA